MRAAPALVSKDVGAAAWVRNQRKEKASAGERPLVAPDAITVGPFTAACAPQAAITIPISAAAMLS